MIDLEFNCPACGGELVVAAEAAGMEFSCPFCTEALTIPDAEALGVEEVIAQGEGGDPESAGSSSSDAAGSREESDEEETVAATGAAGPVVAAAAVGETPELFVEIGKVKGRGKKAFLCPACGRPVWIREGDMGRELACGSCQSEVVAPNPKTNEPARLLGGEVPAANRPAVLPPKRERKDPVLPDGIDAVAPEESEPELEPETESAPEPEPDRGVDVASRKELRSRPSLPPMFTPMEEAQRAAGEYEGWEDTESERKGESKERTLSVAARILKIGMVLFLVAAGPVLYFAYTAAMRDRVEQEEAAAGASRLGEVEADPDKLVPDDTLEGLKVALDGFFGADTIEERARFVRDPALSITRMKEHYKSRGVRAHGYAVEGSINYERDDDTGVYYLYVDVVVDGTWTRGVALEQTPSGHKVDWESFVGYSEIEWKQFMETRPTVPLLFRVRVTPDSYYNYGFSDESKYSCMKLTDLEGSGHCYGYVERGSEDEKRILRIVQRNMAAGVNEGHFILQLQWLEGVKSDKQVLITQVVRENWLLR